MHSSAHAFRRTPGPAGASASLRHHVRLRTRLAPRRARTAIFPAQASHGGGNGGIGGGSVRGTGGPGGSGSGDPQHPLLLVLATAAAALLGNVPSCEASTPPEVEATVEVDGSDVGRLKRLLREVFADLVGVRERLSRLEAGSESEDELPPDPRADVSIRAGAWSRRRRRVAKARSKVELHGQVEAGLHLPWATVRSGRADATRDLRSAGLASGPTTFLTLHKVFREAGQALYARAALRQGGSINITEASYKAQLLPALRVLLSLQGGSLERLAPALNPFADNAGLSRVVRKGHALRSASEQGTGGAVSLLSPPFSLSAGTFVQAAEDGSSTHISSVQTGVSVKGTGALHVVASNARLGCHPVGSTPRESTESTSTVSTGSLRYHGMLAPVATSSGRGSGSLTELGIAGSAKLASGIAVSGWAARHISGSSATTPCGAALHALPDSGGHSATVAVAVLPPSASSKQQRIMWELSTKFAASDGVVLVPGMVMVQSGSNRSMSVSLNTAWHF